MSQAAPPEVLQRILTFARSRRFDDAAVMAERVLLDHPGDSRLIALGGAIEMQRGQFARAAELLKRALSANPDDLTIRANLAEARYHIGDPAGASLLCSDATIAADTSGRLRRLAAFFAQESGDYRRAVELYTSVVAEQPDDWSSWNNLGNCYNSLEDYPEAVAALSKALELQPASQAIRINLGNTYFHGGDPATGEAHLREAAARDPHDPVPFRTLFDQFSKLAQDDKALEAISAALALAPQDPLIQAEYGREAAKHNLYPQSEQAYRAALQLNPTMPEAYVGLASNFERTNTEHLLDGLRNEAVQAGAEPEVIDYIDALRLKRMNDNADALAALDRAGDIGKTGRNLHLRGTLLDRLGRIDEAFEAFAEMNQTNSAHLSEPRERAKFYASEVARSLELVSPDWVASWSPPPLPDARQAPVFLGSFPRSGTTLLDTMLMAADQVVVLEEQPFIAQMQADAGGLEALANLSQAALIEARDQYWKRVEAYAPLTPTSLVIDKQPLHTNNIPAIKRLFPEARFILALRHPMDVLLSCYLTNFRINNAMANFLDLGDGATLYNLTFKHWEKARLAFDLPVKTVVYERLVEDTTRELRPLFDWLGLNWPGDDLDHREAARSRGVVYTASYSQVTEPIYTRARGRWHSYRQHLEPVLETLRPWVEKFGYSLEDDRIPHWPEPPANNP